MVWFGWVCLFGWFWGVFLVVSTSGGLGVLDFLEVLGGFGALGMFFLVQEVFLVFLFWTFGVLGSFWDLCFFKIFFGEVEISGWFRVGLLFPFCSFGLFFFLCFDSSGGF